MINATYDFLIVGGGIFGISSAVTLAERGHKVGLINPDKIPHHLAASTDISKAVRMEYGSDTEYFEMAEECIRGWREWNELFDEEVYREVGFLMLSKSSFDDNESSYEQSSYRQLVDHGYEPERIKGDEISKRFPILKKNVYQEACLNPIGGYCFSGTAVQCLAKYARSIGVSIHEGHTAHKLVIENGRLQAIHTLEDGQFKFQKAIIAAGPYTPYLVPDLKPYFKATGHPVFWLYPENGAPFRYPNLSVFMADIAQTGWYGFPLSETHGVVKVARHSAGLTMDPRNKDRRVTDMEVRDMRTFVNNTFNGLEKAPLVYTRRCLYTDSLDGHFWIDHHPEIDGLMVSTGGSGHGMKMGPVIGKMTADIAEGRQHAYSNRYNWRHLESDTVQREEARHLPNRSL